MSMERVPVTQNIIKEIGRTQITTQLRSKQFRNTNTALASIGTCAISASAVCHNYNFEAMGNTMLTLYCASAVLMSVIKDYDKILDKWREAEAQYEEKMDPPRYTWTVANKLQHSSVTLMFISVLCDDISWHVTGECMQLISILLNLTMTTEYFTRKPRPNDQLKMIFQMLIVVFFDLYNRFGTTQLAVIGGMIQLVLDITE